MKTNTIKLFSITALSSLALLAGVFAAPANDDFVNASPLPSLPYYASVDTTGSTFEVDEPYPDCAYGYPVKTVWFSFTPSVTGTYVAYPDYGYNQEIGYSFPTVLGVYGFDGSSLTSLGCTTTYSTLALSLQAGVTVYLQLGGIDQGYGYGNEGSISFSFQLAPPPYVYAYSYSYEPNTYEPVTFYASVSDPANVYGFTYAWTLSDGTTSTAEYFTHQFAADGDYTATLTATTADGRFASSTVSIQVRTRDIAITKLTVPQSASPNQTKTISIDLKNKLVSDYVQVFLYKGGINGNEELIGSSTIYVPAKTTKVTTAKFNYTFTAADAAIGKATFKAVANILNGRDALPADNVAIATSTVKR